MKIIVSLAMCITLWTLWRHSYHVRHASSNSDPSNSDVEGGPLSRWSTVQCTPNATVSCVTANILHLQFPICLYPTSDDVWVSAHFRAGHHWESDTVIRLLQLLQRHPKATFIDIGANIGSYLLPAAHLGYEVAKRAHLEQHRYIT